jgi:hypothetical protein
MDAKNKKTPARKKGVDTNVKKLTYKEKNRLNVLKQAKEVIVNENLFFVEDVVAFIPITKPTFYDYFPVDSDDFNTLKDLLNQNKIKTKSAIRAKLYKSEKAAELLALYRLICTPEEHQKLNQSYIDHTSKGESINIIDLGAGKKPD